MKPGIILTLVMCFMLSWPLTLEAGKRPITILELKKEISDLMQNRNFHFLERDFQQVVVDFLINARNELVILDVYGDSVLANEYVKETLNYKRVKYKQAKQLTRYTVSIKLVKNDI